MFFVCKLNALRVFLALLYMKLSLKNIIYFGSAPSVGSEASPRFQYNNNLLKKQTQFLHSIRVVVIQHASFHGMISPQRSIAPSLVEVELRSRALNSKQPHYLRGIKSYQRISVIGNVRGLSGMQTVPTEVSGLLFLYIILVISLISIWGICRGRNCMVQMVFINF